MQQPVVQSGLFSQEDTRAVSPRQRKCDCGAKATFWCQDCGEGLCLEHRNLITALDEPVFCVRCLFVRLERWWAKYQPFEKGPAPCDYYEVPGEAAVQKVRSIR